MTNAHCGTCGDPIFRYEGQEFCPTCQEVVTEDGDAEAQAPAEAGEETVDQPASPTEDGEQAGTERQAEPDDGDADQPEPSDLPETRERARVPDRDRRPAEPPRRPEPPARREAADEPAAETRPGGDLVEARESLRRSLTRFARRAEEVEDPRRAREHLEAAREAADALAAISEIR